MEQNFGNLEKQPKCNIRPDILPIALGETKNVEQFRFVHQATLLFPIAHIGQVTMWPTYWKPFQGATKLDLVSQTECEMAISQKSQLSHFPLPQEYLWGTYEIGKEIHFYPCIRTRPGKLPGHGLILVLVLNILLKKKKSKRIGLKAKMLFLEPSSRKS